MCDYRAPALSPDGVPVTRQREFADAIDLAVDHARKLDFASAVGGAVKGMILFYSVPENQAFLAGAFLGAAASARMRPLPGFLFTFVSGLAAKKAYALAAGMRADLHALAVAQGGSGGPDPAKP